MSYRSAACSLALTSRAIRFIHRHPIVLGLGLLVAGLLALGLHFLERREEQAGERRLAVRATMASTFVATYVDGLRISQKSTARSYLEPGRVAGADFARLVEGNRFDSAVLLDSSGRVTQAYPVGPGVLGTRLSSRYWHLGRALEGRDAVSNVVPSAVEGLPVVAVAIPLETSAGGGVFSTAYELASSPLTAYLASAMPMSKDDAYLVDANGAIVASKRPEPRVERLSVRDAALSAAIDRDTEGVVADEGDDRFFIVREVKGTPWRFVAARPLAEVHASWHGQRKLASTVIAVGLSGAVLLICALLASLLETRTRLLRDVARRERVEADLVRERALLAHRATHDALTGLPNRALLFARLEQVFALGAREPQRRAAVLFIDLDGFKPINDAHGHGVGDRVLIAVAERLRRAVRPSDTVARLGGDEFAVLCDPLANTDCAEDIGERIRAALERPIAIGDGRTVNVGASVGIAERPATLGGPHSILADADAAMYATKVARRRLSEEPRSAAVAAATS